MSDAQLLDEWVDDLTRLAPSVDRHSARREGLALLARWDEPHRSYHTRQHLAEMLAALDTLGDQIGIDIPDSATSKVAAWLHDAVYDVQSAPGDTERASARLSRNLLSSLGIGQGVIQQVEALILLTIDHGTDLPGRLADVFVDADLAILAASADRFDEYCAQVRKEYAHVPDAAYAAGRTRILTALVDRQDVYRTSAAQSAWTDCARGNVTRELARLRRAHSDGADADREA